MMLEDLGNPVVADINQGARKKPKGKRRTALEREDRLRRLGDLCIIIFSKLTVNNITRHNVRVV